MKHLSSNGEFQTVVNKSITPIPVTVSIVVICDIRVLIEKKERMIFFPYNYLYPGVSTQYLASSILFEITKSYQEPKKWIPVDIRSARQGLNQDHLNSVIDIGYLTILDSIDLPPVDTKRFDWTLVNLDKKDFPLELFGDHIELWTAAYDMFNLMK